MMDQDTRVNESAGLQNESDEITLLEILSSIKRRWVFFLLTLGILFSATLIGTLLQTPIYESKGRLLIKDDQSASSIFGIAEKLGGLAPTSSNSNPIETEIQVLLSLPLLEEVIEKLDLRDKAGNPLLVEDFEENLSATAVRGTDVILLSYKDKDPKLSAQVVNTLMRNYQRYNIESNRAESRATREFISKELPRSERELEKVQAKIRLFKQKNNLVEPVEEATVSIKGIAKIRENIVETQSELSDVLERAGQLKTKLGGITSEEAIASDKVSSSGPLQTNVQEYQSVIDELAVAQKIYQPNHPTLIELQEKKAALEATLQARLSDTTGEKQPSQPETLGFGENVGSSVSSDFIRAEIEAKGLRQKLQSLYGDLRKASTKSQRYPIIEQQFSELLRNLEISALTYKTLSESFQKAQIAENQNIGNARILHEARVPHEPISPRIFLNLVMGGVLGILAGAGVALLVEAKDIRLLTVQDVRRIYNYTLLGVIPDFSKQLDAPGEKSRAHNLFVRDKPRSMISETYRMINTNLKFSRSGDLQIMVVSSGMPGEGKSSTLANIALAIAELGNKVLLIDSDMRLPSQHQVWEIPNRKGLSNVLVESTDEFQSLPVIPENDYLDILSAGALPPNPTALLESRRFKDFVHSLRCRYDYVLIDSPPLTVASDALIISKVVDGLLLVARPGVINRAAASVAKEMVQQADVTILGLIANGVSPKNETNSLQYYKQEYYGKGDSDVDESLTLTQTSSK